MVAIFMVITLLLFLAADYFVQRSAKKKGLALPENPRGPLAERFLLPRGYFFSPGHAWLELLSTGNARIGVDDFTQKVVGPIDGVRSVPADTSVQRGDLLLTISQSGRIINIPAPISGKVVEVNQELIERPHLLNKDPYVAGWVAVIAPDDIGKDIKDLSIAEESARWLRREVSRFRDFIRSYSPQLIGAEAGMTMADGGMPMQGVLQSANDEAWKAFEQEFLVSQS